MINKTFLTVALSLIAISGPAVADDTPPCRATSEAKALDFWVGDFDVVLNTEERPAAGANHIERVLGGCAIIENWTGASGYQGKSLFTFDARANTWSQVWVTGDTSKPWGLKVKHMTGIAEDGSVFFQSTQTTGDGGSYLDRTTLTPMADGVFRQLIEISRDGGETWQATFDALYLPKEK